MRARNPQIFQMLEKMQKNNNNPNEMINQIISKYKPEQINNFRQYANNFGISNEQLDNLGIKAK